MIKRVTSRPGVTDTVGIETGVLVAVGSKKKAQQYELNEINHAIKDNYDGTEYVKEYIKGSFREI